MRKLALILAGVALGVGLSLSIAPSNELENRAIAQVVPVPDDVAMRHWRDYVTGTNLLPPVSSCVRIQPAAPRPTGASCILVEGVGGSAPLILLAEANRPLTHSPAETATADVYFHFPTNVQCPQPAYGFEEHYHIIPERTVYPNSIHHWKHQPRQPIRLADPDGVGAWCAAYLWQQRTLPGFNAIDEHLGGERAEGLRAFVSWEST